MRNRPQYKINTLDLNPNQGIGIALPFSPDTIFTINYTTKDQIKSNLLNFMLTNKGERFFSIYTIGCHILVHKGFKGNGKEWL